MEVNTVAAHKQPRIRQASISMLSLSMFSFVRDVDNANVAIRGIRPASAFAGRSHHPARRLASKFTSSIWLVWHVWQKTPGPYMVGMRSLLGAPRFENGSRIEILVVHGWLVDGYDVAVDPTVETVAIWASEIGRVYGQ
ncbi:hypothetical protein MVEN_01894500 [Mycena venus]|uniref:Uncharacterized protein n=1 Tax=Mycena venus TaxID=2733690 RepID=A0A8H6XFY7_9AGAR|nr:hypothetical protein MVEN_01894500 [Mycena venus]